MKLLHANVLGSTGTPFIILHGFLGSGDNWKTLGKRFSELGYQVHILDQRNHGKSFHDAEFNYEAMAEDLHIYCTHFGLKDIVLLGHSMGGKVAMTFALRHSKSVKQLIVADIAPRYYPPHHQAILQGLKAVDFDKVTTRQDAEIILNNFVTEPGTRQFLLKNLYWIEPNRLGWRMNLEVLVDSVEEIGQELQDHTPVTCPSLFLKGSSSDYVLPKDEIRIMEQFENAKIQEVANAGHWLHAENPNDFFNAVASFLAKNE